MAVAATVQILIRPRRHRRHGLVDQKHIHHHQHMDGMLNHQVTN